jgi:hypothetical protein
MTRLSFAVAAVVLFVVLVFSAVAFAVGSTQGTLALNAVFRGPFEPIVCPSGAPSTTECYLDEGEGGVPGLGPTSLKFTLLYDLPNGQNDPSCRLMSTPDATFTVVGKGQIQLSARNPSCQPAGTTAISGSMEFTVRGGSGIYAGATGGGTMELVAPFPNATTSWTGTLTVPGLDLDTTPPTISGASSKVVKVKRNTRRARVRYTLTASDAVDGAVPVTCNPRSGAFFPVGKTRVHCSATDSSANRGNASFTITVRRRRQRVLAQGATPLLFTTKASYTSRPAPETYPNALKRPSEGGDTLRRSGGKWVVAEAADEWERRQAEETQKKKPQETLKERRSEKRAAKEFGSG